MNFDLTEEQSIMTDALARFAQERYGSDARRRYQAEREGYSTENWRALAEMGLFALPLRESSGGLGGSAADFAAALDALGYGLIVEPLLTRARAAVMFDLGAKEVLRNRWLAPLASGEAQLTFAEGFAGSVQVSQSPTANVLSGTISFVPNAIGADAFVVLTGAFDAPSAWFVPLNHSGVEMRSWRMIDGGYAGVLMLENVVLGADECLNVGGELHRWRAETRTAACAEMQGILRRLFDETLAYLKTRRQFGVTIGSFQALQHRMARLYVALEQSKSLLLRALATPDNEADAWLRAQNSVASHFTRTAAWFAEQCLQLHGGMGVTDELLIAAGLKRLHVLTALAGPPRQ